MCPYARKDIGTKLEALYSAYVSVTPRRYTKRRPV